MIKVKRFIGSKVMLEGLRYIEKDPMENFPKLMNWGEKLIIRENHKKMLDTVKEVLEDQDCNWNILIQRIISDLSPKTREKLVTNFFVNSVFTGMAQGDKVKERHGVNVPWAILLDPTAACNLKCIGCWASEYDKTSSLDNDTLDKIITEGKELRHLYVSLFRWRAVNKEERLVGTS